MFRSYEQAMQTLDVAQKDAEQARDSAVDAKARASEHPFLGRALQRLPLMSLSPELRTQLSQAFTAWLSSGSEEAMTVVAETVNQIARKTGVTSRVELATRPKDGAVVKYQTVGQRQRGEGAPVTAKRLTTCVESMFIGNYHIWSERRGKATSDTESVYAIVEKEERVELLEEDRRS